MQSFLIKFLLLLSASLSVHSALALPLSSVLASNYHTVSKSDKRAEQFNASTKLNDFAYKQFSHSKLQSSLLNLLEQNNDESIIIQVFLREVIKFDISSYQVIAQTQARQSYQAQLSAHIRILGIQNSLYSQKNSYKAKLQQQKTP